MLDAERPEKISGNYGSLDQIAMLRWLKSNIAAFGGDRHTCFPVVASFASVGANYRLELLTVSVTKT